MASRHSDTSGTVKIPEKKERIKIIKLYVILFIYFIVLL